MPFAKRKFSKEITTPYMGAYQNITAYIKVGTKNRYSTQFLFINLFLCALSRNLCIFRDSAENPFLVCPLFHIRKTIIYGYLGGVNDEDLNRKQSNMMYFRHFSVRKYWRAGNVAHSIFPLFSSVFLIFVKYSIIISSFYPNPGEKAVRYDRPIFQRLLPTSLLLLIRVY